MKVLITFCKTFLIISILLISCTATDHSLYIAPPEIEKPVSASSYYIDDNGNIISHTYYMVVYHFNFLRNQKAQWQAKVPLK